MEKILPEDDKQFVDENAQTIRPGRSPANAPVPLPVAQAPSPRIGTISEDFADFDFADDDAKLEEKVADFKVSTSPRYRRCGFWILKPHSSSRHRHVLGCSILMISRLWVSLRRHQAPRPRLFPSSLTEARVPLLILSCLLALPLVHRLRACTLVHHHLLVIMEDRLPGKMQNASIVNPSSSSTPKTTTRITMIFSANPAAQVSWVGYCRWLTDAEGEQLLNLCKLYSLIPVCRTNHGYVYHRRLCGAS